MAVPGILLVFQTKKPVFFQEREDVEILPARFGEMQEPAQGLRPCRTVDLCDFDEGPCGRRVVDECQRFDREQAGSPGKVLCEGPFLQIRDGRSGVKAPGDSGEGFRPLKGPP